ncbi:cytochrome P450 monooxygenase pc-2 [Coprinopsis marcescibilis]|uniref:Cytochrome P450 monooxygenase pc-2 n=1 Tax=Coprinopsis marcescibilis TaxID=230819 RepID=A0A5C3KTE8_COPMA|nr:cytochrome P450 monooxygenase pc-2 [Coprinopsis marcescibilis]
MPLPPGISYILKRAPSLLLPGVITYFASKYVVNYCRLTLPRWILCALVLLAKPLQFVVQVQYARYMARSEARRLGVRIVPHVQEGATSIVNKLLDMFENGYPCDILTEWAGQYGNTFETRLFTDSFIWTTEPDHVKAIMATEFENFPKEQLFLDQTASLLGTGVFSVNGDLWKFHRAMTRPFFTKDRISDFDIFDVHAEKALSIARSRLDEGHPIDFQELAARFTLDSASSFLFSKDIESLQAGLGYPPNSGKTNSDTYETHPSNMFARAFLEAITNGTRRTFYGSEWPLMEFWGDTVRPHRLVVDQYSDHVINQYRRQEVRKAGMEADTLLAHLMEAGIDDNMIKDELFNMLVAGRDTTACTLSYGMYMLTQHPEVASRLREEIMANVGPRLRPTYENIKEMKYLRAFINEVLRLYPPVPINWRSARNSIVLSSKATGEQFYVPAGTTVRYSVFMMHRRKDLWGEDADIFDPARFLDERMKKYLIPNPYIFMPFNAGPRICLGQQFAYNEISFFLVRMFQQFSDFTFAHDAQIPEYTPPKTWEHCEGRKGIETVVPGANLTLHIKGGLWIRMR